MADYLLIGASSRHEYQVRLRVEGYEVTATVDTGLTHPGCRVGLALDETDYRLIRNRLRALFAISIIFPVTPLIGTQREGKYV